MAHLIAHIPDMSQGCFGSVLAFSQLFDPRFQFEQGVSLDAVSSVPILQSKIGGQFNEYQNEYQNDTKRCIPMDADTSSSPTQPQKNLNKTGQKRPIPTLASIQITSIYRGF